MPAKPPAGLPRPWFLRRQGASSRGLAVPVGVRPSPPLWVCCGRWRPQTRAEGPFCLCGEFCCWAYSRGNCAQAWIPEVKAVLFVNGMSNAFKKRLRPASLG